MPRKRRIKKEPSVAEQLNEIREQLAAIQESKDKPRNQKWGPSKPKHYTIALSEEAIEALRACRFYLDRPINQMVEEMIEDFVSKHRDEVPHKFKHKRPLVDKDGNILDDEEEEED